MSAPKLRPYQLEAGRAVEAALLDHGQNRLLVKKPTGTGKTVWFASLLTAFPRLRDWLQSGDITTGARMLVIAHREELLDQAREKIERQNPGLMVSIEQGDRHANAYSDVIIASIQTLAARKFHRLKRLLARHKFKLVIVDEAHHAAARTYRTALALLGFLPLEVSSETGDMENPSHDDVEEMKAALTGWDARAPKDQLLIGVTATPNRSDAIGLECVFQTIAYSYGMKQAIDDGYIVPPVPWVVETETSLDEVRTTRGEFNQRDLADAVNNPARNALALAAWNDHGYGLPTIGFTVDVQHAHDLADTFVRGGVKALAISGETPKEDRRIALRQYREGQILALMNCMVLTEGTDLPLTACILHAKPTKSATLYEQMTGRGGRPLPPDPVGDERVAAIRAGLKLLKSEFIVIDIVDIARRHSLQTAPVLYGLPPGLKSDGKDLRALAEELEEFKTKYPAFNVEELLESGRYSLADLRARASTFDIWTIPDLGIVKEMVSMSWLKAGEDNYRLQYPWADGTEVLSVERDLLGHYDITLTLRPNGQPGQPAPTPRQRTICAQVSTLENALALAESFVQSERRSASRLTDKSAPWRFRPASQGQIGFLRKLKVTFQPGISSGEASDLINLAKARQGR